MRNKKVEKKRFLKKIARFNIDNYFKGESLRLEFDKVRDDMEIVSVLFQGTSFFVKGEDHEKNIKNTDYPVGEIENYSILFIGRNKWLSSIVVYDKKNKRDEQYLMLCKAWQKYKKYLKKIKR